MPVMWVDLGNMADTSKLTSSGAAVSRTANIVGMLLGTDGVNDPTITIYEGTDNTGEEVIPTTTYDASALGLNGVMPGGIMIRCSDGIYVEIACAGTVEVVVFFNHFKV